MDSSKTEQQNFSWDEAGRQSLLDNSDFRCDEFYSFDAGKKPEISPSTCKSVLNGIYSYGRSKGGTSFPAIDTLALWCNFGERTVIRAVKRLRELEVILVRDRGPTSNYYTIDWGRLSRFDSRRSATVALLPKQNEVPLTTNEVPLTTNEVPLWHPNQSNLLEPPLTTGEAVVAEEIFTSACPSPPAPLPENGERGERAKEAEIDWRLITGRTAKPRRSPARHRSKSRSDPPDHPAVLRRAAVAKILEEQGGINSGKAQELAITGMLTPDQADQIVRTFWLNRDLFSSNGAITWRIDTGRWPTNKAVIEAPTREEIEQQQAAKLQAEETRRRDREIQETRIERERAEAARRRALWDSATDHQRCESIRELKRSNKFFARLPDGDPSLIEMAIERFFESQNGFFNPQKGDPK